MLVFPKDSNQQEKKCGIIYELLCELIAKYISETEWALRKRIKEHQRESFSVGHHLVYNKH